ncbi:hypothetical protein OGAPHI_007412 [Ogataea philodendri]|uniref:DNA damage checkpoint control protein RAD17 n=1 Tax=Ogataea philodendri TaxID=1378263 RepID=A0A9P8NVZ1_9ASCO|nr:uncharacterized protein OGAPHI_007412 [Ogataea philodendri]KAH3660207.1 hypothetical protein OGAPHI_007412 [Ogataea philodendri]
MALETISFSASTSNIVAIHQLISSILPFGGSCLINITANGLGFSVVDNNICKVFLTLDKRIFSSFQFNPTWIKKERVLVSDDEGTTDDDADLDSVPDRARSISVNLDLKSLIETINIHIPGDKENIDLRTKCIMSYQGEGHPFVLTFEDDFIIERCELTTLFIDPSDFEADSTDSQSEPSLFQLDTSKTMLDLTLQSSIVYDALKDMKDLNTQELIIYCSNTEPESQKKLVLISKSEDDSIGYSKLLVPTRKPFLKELSLFKPEPTESHFQMVPCSTTISSFYNFAYFSKILKAIRLSKSIKIRKDLGGLTSVSLLVGSSSLNGSNLSSADGKNLFYGTGVEFTTLESTQVDDSGAFRNGYHNRFVEQLIREDENVKVIKIARNGQLTTIDDYFQSVNTQLSVPSSAGEPNELQITDELAQSVLGLGPAPAQEPKQTGPTKPSRSKKRKLEPRKNNKSDKADRLQTVGGAIEIPLFI